MINNEYTYSFTAADILLMLPCPIAFKKVLLKKQLPQILIRF